MKLPYLFIFYVSFSCAMQLETEDMPIPEGDFIALRESIGESPLDQDYILTNLYKSLHEDCELFNFFMQNYNGRLTDNRDSKLDTLCALVKDQHGKPIEDTTCTLTPTFKKVYTARDLEFFYLGNLNQALSQGWKKYCAQQQAIAKMPTIIH